MVITRMEIFSIAEDSKFAKCKKCKELVVGSGDSAKSFNTTKLVHHIKTKHTEEFGQLMQMKKRKQNEREVIKRKGHRRRVLVDYVS